jgi:predicted Fe-Mo cluster-binding NifX family protein
MMKIAIPVFNSRISPRFDCAQEMLLVDIADGKIMAQWKISINKLSSIEKNRTMLNLGVDTLICGGIDRHSMQWLKYHDLPVYAWLTGDVQDILTCFLTGGLTSITNAEATGQWCQHRRFKGGKQNINRGRR